MPVIRGQEIGEDRDEGRGQRAPGHHGEEQIRQFEGGVKGVQLRADAEAGGDDHVAHQAHGRGQAKGGGHDQGVAQNVAAAFGLGGVGRGGHKIS